MAENDKSKSSKSFVLQSQDTSPLWMNPASEVIQTLLAPAGVNRVKGASGKSYSWKYEDRMQIPLKNPKKYKVYKYDGDKYYGTDLHGIDALQAYAMDHGTGYAVVNKGNPHDTRNDSEASGNIQIYDRNGEPVYSTDLLSMGSRNFNTILPVHSNGHAMYGKGNSSTPEGLSFAAGLGYGFGSPSVVRARVKRYDSNNNPILANQGIASSIHYFDNFVKPNGCIRVMTRDGIKKICTNLPHGTPIWTNPLNSDFNGKLSLVYRDGKLAARMKNPSENPNNGRDLFGNELSYNTNYVADIPRSINFDKSKLLPESQSNIETKVALAGLAAGPGFGNIAMMARRYGASKWNREKESESRYIESLNKNKAAIMKMYDLSNKEYDDLAGITMGLLGRESESGTDIKYDLVKKRFPLAMAKSKEKYGINVHSSLIDQGIAFAKSYDKAFEDLTIEWNSDAWRNYIINHPQMSIGPAQMKIGQKSDELLDELASFGIYPDDVVKDDKVAVAALLQLIHSRRNEVGNTMFRDKDGNSVNLNDALLYIYNGKKGALNNGSATPYDNIYLKEIYDRARRLGFEVGDDFYERKKLYEDIKNKRKKK